MWRFIVCAFCQSIDINNMSAFMRCRCDERSAIRSGARGGEGEAMSCVMKGYIMMYFWFWYNWGNRCFHMSRLALFPTRNQNLKNKKNLQPTQSDGKCFFLLILFSVEKNRYRIYASIITILLYSLYIWTIPCTSDLYE